MPDRDVKGSTLNRRMKDRILHARNTADWRFPLRRLQILTSSPVVAILNVCPNFLQPQYVQQLVGKQDQVALP